MLTRSCRTELIVVSRDGETWETIEVDAATNFGFGSIQRVGRRLFALGYGYYGRSGGAVVLDLAGWPGVDSDQVGLVPGSRRGRHHQDAAGHLRGWEERARRQRQHHRLPDVAGGCGWLVRRGSRDGHPGRPAPCDPGDVDGRRVPGVGSSGRTVLGPNDPVWRRRTAGSGPCEGRSGAAGGATSRTSSSRATGSSPSALRAVDTR